MPNDKLITVKENVHQEISMIKVRYMFPSMSKTIDFLIKNFYKLEAKIKRERALKNK